MKRLLLFIIVAGAIAWTTYSGYELFFYKGNPIAPERIFCEKDGSVLLVNRIQETKSVDYFSAVKKNPFVEPVKSMEIQGLTGLRIYLSGERPILILEKETNWKENEFKQIESSFKEQGTSFQKKGNIILISKVHEACNSENEKLDFFIEGDKKASANFWNLNKHGFWERTDVYALDKGFFEYRSSTPNNTYGKPVNDLTEFVSVLPESISNYTFMERFYAQDKDSVFAQGEMSHWVDLGYVTATYQDEIILISDYRSQQNPGLILLEKSPVEDSVLLMDDIRSFSGFQLTTDFPKRRKGRIFIVELEDKVVFTEKESIARQVLVDYQLGRTLALNPNKKEQFFGGLPSQVNMRSISKSQKTSLTWKKNLLFEVSTKPPGERITEEEKTTWSKGLALDLKTVTPIPDHLRAGVSVFLSGDDGSYELIGPNGNLIWKGNSDQKIIGEPTVIDIFENDKHQVLYRTEKNVNLLDLNGNTVGGFPYKSEERITTGISEFVWNGTKRFLFGNEKGEVTMLNSSGQELTIIQAGRHPLRGIPYALNVNGNLRVWVVNEENEQYLGYLENPAKAEILEKTTANHFIKTNGTVKAYFEQEGNVYFKAVNDSEATLLSRGSILSSDDNHIFLKQENKVVVFDHGNNLVFTQEVPFNEISTVDLVSTEKNQFLVVMDYLQNKIHLYGSGQNDLPDFPKEGRDKAYTYLNKDNNVLYIYTYLSKSLICFKTEL
ncbi:MAG: hypothetical protein R3277_09010 [Brumimicrobium sp.]|nr:hypothetical protein [Brumimicrobium sp.]